MTQRSPIRGPRAQCGSSEPPRTRGANSASLEGSPSGPSTAPRVSASLETTPRQKGQTTIRSPSRRTEALNANHSSATPRSDGVRPPLRTVAATRVLSANSGHCTAIPSAVAPLWEPAMHCANVRGAVPSTVLPTPCTSLVLSPPQEPSNGMGTTLGRGPDLDQIKTPACRTLGTPPRQVQGTVPSTGATMPPAGAARTPAQYPRNQDAAQDNCHARRHALYCTTVYFLQ